jgi:hypothetical protein
MAIALLTPGAALAAPQTCTTVQCVIAFGDQQITNRLNSLNTLSGKITNQRDLGHLTSAQAGTLQGNVTTNQNGLTALKTKLDAETRIAAARQDVRTIYTQFRIYAVVLPRDYHVIWLDILVNMDAKLRAAQPKIQEAIADASGLSDPDKDGDMAELNAAFSDFQAQLSAAEGQIDGAQGLLPTLTAANFDANPSLYQQNWTDFRNDIRTAHHDIVAAAADLHKIARVLKDLINEQNPSNPQSGSEP